LLTISCQIYGRKLDRDDPQEDREQLVRYIKSKNYIKDVRYFSFLEPKIEKLHIFAV
jgi:hypothetical protein